MKNLALLALLVSTAALAATTYSLPDPAVYVNLQSNRTTIGIDGVYYQAPSAFAYVSECSKPDGARYRCNIETETDVPLYATDGSGRSITATITAQFSSILITSGHNYWRSSQVVLGGEVTSQ